MISLCVHYLLNTALLTLSKLSLMWSDIDIYLPEYVTCSAILCNNEVKKLQLVIFGKPFILIICGYLFMECEFSFWLNWWVFLQGRIAVARVIPTELSFRRIFLRYFMKYMQFFFIKWLVSANNVGQVCCVYLHKNLRLLLHHLHV